MLTGLFGFGVPLGRASDEEKGGDAAKAQGTERKVWQIIGEPTKVRVEAEPEDAKSFCGGV
jgi:hypothetical protein